MTPTVARIIAANAGALRCPVRDLRTPTQRSVPVDEVVTAVATVLARDPRG